MISEERITDCLNKICGLMFEYGNKWIFHLDEMHETCDVENTTRERYGLWTTEIDVDAFLEAHGW